MNKIRYWNPKINEEVNGTLIDKLENVGIFKSRVYKIQQADGIINVWGKKQLDSIMEATEIGDKISIRYVGTKEVNEHEMKIFELEILNEQ